MRFLSLCSGIEAASVAWQPLGWKASAFAEIDKFPGAVLAHHYPDTPNHGDMNRFKDWPDATLDVLCGGTPCQSFSTAGLRRGLDDPRGNLMLTFGAVAARYRPRWLVWENVPGVLSSNGGRDFGAFLGLLGILGYGFAYRVLDAQFVRVDGYGRAVPQRRNRVFVVGCLGDWRSAAAVLLERESLRGDSAPRRSAGASVAPCIRAGAANGGAGHGARSGDSKDELIVPVVGALAGSGPGSGWRLGADEAAAGQLVAYGGNNSAGAVSVSTALTAHPGGRYDYDSETFIAHTLRGEGVDGFNGALTGQVAATMGTRGSAETASGPTVMVPVPFDTTQITSALNRNNPKAGDPCHPLAAGAHAPAIAFQERGRADGRSLEVGGDVAYAMTAPSGGSRAQERNVLAASAVRRLTPRECERLMGFPDDYTLVPWRGGMASDGPRYKALGNSWAVNCARWIGWRIAVVDALKVPARSEEIAA